MMKYVKAPMRGSYIGIVLLTCLTTAQRSIQVDGGLSNMNHAQDLAGSQQALSMQSSAILDKALYTTNSTLSPRIIVHFALNSTLTPDGNLLHTLNSTSSPDGNLLHTLNSTSSPDGNPLHTLNSTSIRRNNVLSVARSASTLYDNTLQTSKSTSKPGDDVPGVTWSTLTPEDKAVHTLNSTSPPASSVVHTLNSTSTSVNDENGAQNKSCSYKAAALMFTTRYLDVAYTNLTHAQKHVKLNLDHLSYFIADAARGGARIVVLPEGTLWSPGLGSSWMWRNASEQRRYVRHFGESVPANGSIPCDMDGGKVLQSATFSCIAREKNIMVVANMLDVVPCVQDCNPLDAGGEARWNYNALVVFDNIGMIVAKYYKQHLYGEFPAVDQASHDNPPAIVELPLDNCSHETVRIGLMICADLFHGTPWGEEALKKHSIKHLAISAAWASNPPLYIFSMLVQGFAHLHGLTVIAANSGEVYFSSGGIFAKDAALTQKHDDNGDLNEVLFATVPVEDTRLLTESAKSLRRDAQRNGENEGGENSKPATIIENKEFAKRFSRDAQRIGENKDGNTGGAITYENKDRPSFEIPSRKAFGAGLPRRGRCKSGFPFYETPEGPCDMMSVNSSKITGKTWIRLEVNSDDGTVNCKAQVRTHGNGKVRNAFHLIAVNQTVTPRATPDPYQITGCFLLPCVDATTNGTLESCSNTHLGYWPAHPLFTHIHVVATIRPPRHGRKSISMRPLAAGVSGVPAFKEHKVYATVHSIETQYRSTSSNSNEHANVTRYAVAASNSTLVMAGLFGLQNEIPNEDDALSAVAGEDTIRLHRRFLRRKA